jgi:hypothetical protein
MISLVFLRLTFHQFVVTNAQDVEYCMSVPKLNLDSNVNFPSQVSKQNALPVLTDTNHYRFIIMTI